MEDCDPVIHVVGQADAKYLIWLAISSTFFQGDLAMLMKFFPQPFLLFPQCKKNVNHWQRNVH